jgi:hypothetical protein
MTGLENNEQKLCAFARRNTMLSEHRVGQAPLHFIIAIREETQMRNYALRTLSLSLLVAIGLMAVGAAAAQAGSEVTVGGAPLAGEKAIKGTVVAWELLTTGGIKIGCTSGTFTGTIKNVNKVGEGKVQALYTGCTVLGASSVCKVYEELPKVGQDSFLASLEVQFIVHEGKHYLLTKGLGVNEQLTDFVILDPLLLERCTLPEEHYALTGLGMLSLPDILTLAKLHKVETLNPELMAKLFPSHQHFLGKEKAHLAAGTVYSVELASGESWRVQ